MKEGVLREDWSQSIPLSWWQWPPGNTFGSGAGQERSHYPFHYISETILTHVGTD